MRSVKAPFGPAALLCVLKYVVPDLIGFDSIQSLSQAAGEKHSKTTSDCDPDNLIGDSCIKYGFRLVVQICFQLTLFQVFEERSA